MKWIKASERLPVIPGNYFVKNVWGQEDGKRFLKPTMKVGKGYITAETEWLDESPAPVAPPNGDDVVSGGKLTVINLGIYDKEEIDELEHFLNERNYNWLWEPSSRQPEIDALREENGQLKKELLSMSKQKCQHVYTGIISNSAITASCEMICKYCGEKMPQHKTY